MEFNTPLLAILAVVVGLFWSASYWRLFKKPQLVLPGKYIIRRQITFRLSVFIVGLIAWALITFAIMQPRMPQGNIKSTIDANDIFFVVDTSPSMRGLDFKPNRMEVAKRKILEFIDLKPTDRIGLIVFSAKAFTLMPLTTDHKLVKQIVSQINTKMRGIGQGTNIGDALALAAGRASNSLAKNKVIILMTDGAANVGTISPLGAAEQVKDQGMKIYSIGIGSNGDTFMTDRDHNGRARRRRIPGGGYDMEILEKLSSITGGKSFSASDERGLKSVLEEIDKLEKSKIDTFGQIIYDELYHQFLLWGVLLLLFVEFLRRFIVKEGS
ncbi:MAG: VWA domain-containing protein [Bacteriovoracaceae bacterium]|nr:VWA domain-containing protein [Bacteriovoracaceae bacterium]